MSDNPVHAADAAVPVRFDGTVPIIEIPTDLDFEAVREWLLTEVPEFIETINGRASRLDLRGRRIEHLEVRRLMHLLRENFSLDITGVYSYEADIHRFAERELKLKLFRIDADNEAPDEPEAVQANEDLDEPADEEQHVAESDADVPDTLLMNEDLEKAEAKAKAEAATEHTPSTEADDTAAEIDSTEAEAIEASSEAQPPAGAQEEEPARENWRTPMPKDPGRRTLAIERTVRGGNVVRFDGDIVVYGDVNPGGEVVATGSVTVLGALKGVAHAGATGDENCFILSFDFRPTQVRIARKIAIAPSREFSGPELARVRGEQIAIEPYRGRL